MFPSNHNQPYLFLLINVCKFRIAVYDIYVWTCQALSVLDVTLLLKSSGLVFFFLISCKCPYEGDGYILISHTVEVQLHIYITSFPSMQPFLAIQYIFRLNAATTISVEKHILYVASGSYWLVLQQDLWLYSTLTSTDGITSFSRGTNASSV